MTFDFWNTLCREPAAGYLVGRRVAAQRAVLDERGVDCPTDRLVVACTRARDAFETEWLAGRQFRGPDGAAVCLAALEDIAPPGGILAPALADAFLGAADHADLLLLPGIAEVLAVLEDTGVALGIVCDVGLTSSPVLRAHLERHGVLRHFDHWSFSDEVGVYKPDRRIFDHALAGLGVEPDRAWHVGDRRRTDVAGAQAVGMGTARVTLAYDDADPAEGPSGDVVIASYNELLPALGLA